MSQSTTDSRFVVDDRFEGEAEAESSTSQVANNGGKATESHTSGESDQGAEPNDAVGRIDDNSDEEEHDGFGEGMLAQGFSGPSTKVVKPLTVEELAKFKAAQEKTGVVYISRIPPGMQPAKVRHLMSMYGEIGRVYLQPEGTFSSFVLSTFLALSIHVDAKRAYLRRKYTSTKKMHFTEGWVEFKDKKVARSVAEMLNAQPIGGKKGTRWRDDVWTMKYLPKFKWSMLTEQIGGFCSLTLVFQLRRRLLIWSPSISS